MNYGDIIHLIAFIVLPLLFAITFHEVAHGWVASKLGDKTALKIGRVTFNPMKHIDPLGTLILPILMLILSKFTFAFGWAKPVPITWHNFKKPRRDIALVAFAGPFANLLMALLWAAIAKVSLTWGSGVEELILRNITSFFYNAGIFGILINVILMILNLIPLPPLDGSRIVSVIFPPKVVYNYSKIDSYGIWILLSLLLFGLLNRILVTPVICLSQLIRSFFGL